MTIDKYFTKTIQVNLKNGILYFGGSIVQLLIGVFTQPVFSKYLEAEDFAVIGYYGAIGQFFFPLFNLALTSYYFVNYYKNSDSENKSLATSILSFLTIANSISFVLGHIFIFTYFHLFKVSFYIIPFATLTMIGLSLDVYKTFFLVDCRINKKGWNYLLILSISVIMNAAFSLLFVVGFKGRASGKMLGPVISQLLIVAFIIYSFSKSNIYIFKGIGNKKQIKEALKFCYPIILASYVYWPIQNIDKIFLERTGNYHELGFYNVGIMMSALIDTLTIAIFQGFEPDMYRFYAVNDRRKFYQVSFIYFIGVIIIILLFNLFSVYIVGFLTAGRYTRASFYANINVVSIFFFRLAGLFQIILTAAHFTKQLLYINIVAGIASIFIYKIFINQLSFAGASYGKIAVGLTLMLVSFGFYYRQRVNQSLNF